MLIKGNILDPNLILPEGKFRTVVSSPPYWGQRSYTDLDEEIGKGSVESYKEQMAQVARLLFKSVTDDGVVWWNHADTNSGSGGAGGDYNKGGDKDGKPRWRQGKSDRKPFQRMNIPHLVIEQFEQAGFHFRWDGVWEKPTPRRESTAHVRNPGNSHEYISMLSKSRNYIWNDEALTEKGSVWHFPPSRGKNHLAPFPDELPRRCILLTSIPGDCVFDPFVGSGTTLRVANELGREGWGVDLV